MSSYQVSEDYLLNHAYRNVWCTPEQDKQAIIQPARVTPPNGVWSYFNYQWKKIAMPISGGEARFHIYQIGQVHPSILGLLAKANTWISAKTVMEEECVLMDVYTSKGIMIPRVLCWYIVTSDKNLLIAIRKPSEKPNKLIDVDLESEPIFMRLYSNAYFNSIQSVMVDKGIQILSLKANSISEINAFQTQVQALPSYGGRFFFINGRRVSKIDLVCAKPGDYIECIFDASIKREIIFKVTELQEFESTLDDLNKFLLHYPGLSDIIDYQDDVDMYLGETYLTNNWQGVYMHKNDSRTLRMVTHRDYSIPVIRINGTQAANPFLTSSELELRLTIRYSGYNRSLVNENNRIAELYKLPPARVLEALVGVDATVSVWDAGNLEASAYTNLMRQPQGGVTREMVQQAYGYNAMAKLLGDTPQLVTSFNGQKVVEIPEGLRGCCTVYEYDANGRLLYFQPHTVDNTYSCQAADTVFTEVLFGLGGTTLETFDNTENGVLSSLHNYRFYVAPSTGGIKIGDWEDMTGDPYYLAQNGGYEWVISEAPFNRVLSNKRHLAYTFQMAAIAGVFEFDITVLKNGTYQKLDMPLGELDIFFNGYSLIEGLDYVIREARVVITTKKYFDNALPLQTITIRYTGFCNKDMSRTPAPDVGFVYHGNLSTNNRFNIRDDKVMRIVCGGGVRMRSALDFAEDGVTVNVDAALNGAPYAIRDIIVPMNNYLIGGNASADKTYEFRAASQAIDEEISDYLTLWLPEQDVVAANVIGGRYIVYSPFLSRIIDDLKSGVLWDDKFHEQFGDDWLRGRLASYNRLLDFDPIGPNMTIDHRYVVIHPHPYGQYVSLDMYQWRVLDRVVKIYAPTVDLSSTINVLQF